jgi:hypothetical protein
MKPVIPRNVTDRITPRFPIERRHVHASFMLCSPDVVLSLERQPETSAIAECLAEPQSKILGHRLLLVEQLVQRIPADAEVASEGYLAEPELRQHILTQDFAGMCGLESRSLGDENFSLHGNPPVAREQRALHPTRKRSADWRGW